MTIGPMSGGAIKIDPDEHVTMGLCVGEGLETCLAGRQTGYAPAWAVLSAGGIAKFPVLPGLDGLTILAEMDNANMRAVLECGKRWRQVGIEVIVIDPVAGNDINDSVRKVAA